MKLKITRSVTKRYHGLQALTSKLSEVLSLLFSTTASKRLLPKPYQTPQNTLG